jgi:molybdate transport system regulatory protein
MNQLLGKIQTIQESGGLALVDVEAGGHGFTALMISSPHLPLWVRGGKAVRLIFKETEVALARNLAGAISMRNQLPCKVKSIKRGEILTVVDLLFRHYTLRSAITTRSADRLKLRTGSRVTALIKANEITLSEQHG